MLDVLSALTSLLMLFGGLAFWPLVRFGGGLSGGASDWLKWQFYAHILLLAGSFVLLQYFHAIEHPDRVHLYFLPYAIGALSWGCALIILFGSGLWRRVGKDPGDPD